MFSNTQDFIGYDREYGKTMGMVYNFLVELYSQVSFCTDITRQQEVEELGSDRKTRYKALEGHCCFEAKRHKAAC